MGGPLEFQKNKNSSPYISIVLLLTVQCTNLFCRLLGFEGGWGLGNRNLVKILKMQLDVEVSPPANGVQRSNLQIHKSVKFITKA